MFFRVTRPDEDSFYELKTKYPNKKYLILENEDYDWTIYRSNPTRYKTLRDAFISKMRRDANLAGGLFGTKIDVGGKPFFFYMVAESCPLLYVPRDVIIKGQRLQIDTFGIDTSQVYHTGSKDKESVVREYTPDRSKSMPEGWKEGVLDALESATLDYKLNLSQGKIQAIDYHTGNLGYQLDSYQREVVDFMLDKKRCIVASSTGTGKTSMTLSACMVQLTQEQEQSDILIVCEKKLVTYWEEQVNLLCQGDYTDIHGYKITPKRFIITWYNRVKKCVERVKRGKGYTYTFDPDNEFLDVSNVSTIIVDESHLLVNTDTQLSRSMLALTEYLQQNRPTHLSRAYLLTATPVRNGLEDTRFYFKALGHPLGVKTLTLTHYTHLFNIKYGEVPDMDLMSQFFNDVCISRSTEEMGLSIEYDIVIERIEKSGDYLFSEAKILRKAKEIYIQSSGNSFKVNTALMPLRVLSGYHKIPFVQTYIQENPDVPLLVMSHYNFAVLDKIGEEQGSVVYKADTKIKDRDSLVKDFEAGETNLILTQIKIGSTGLNLGRAEAMILNELPWSVSDFFQAIGRVLRRTRTGKPTIIIPIISGSIEERVLKIIMRKLNESRLVSTTDTILSKMTDVLEMEAETAELIKQEIYQLLFEKN
jgi:superfamily II DNA or RNA helicase